MYLRKYETITLVDPTKGSDGVNKVLDRMREALTKTDAKEIRFEDWGRRKTAYQLQSYKVDRAHYLYLQYLANNTTVHELERLMKITEEAMVYQTILLEDRVVADAFDFEAAAVEETSTINRGEDADAPFVVETVEEEVIEAAPEEPAAEKAVEAAPEEPAAEKAVEAAAEEPAAEEAPEAAADEAAEATTDDDAKSE